MMWRTGSLFSGYGGLDLAIKAGLRALGQSSRVAWFAEKDPYCRAVLRKHWPRTHCYEDVHDIDDTAPAVDLLGGGFPCQDISIAGGRAGLAGARSGLWYEFVRVIRCLRPRVVFVENVPELAAHLGAVLGPLAELGFDAEWDLFDAAAVGAPHRRERLFLLAYAHGDRLADAQQQVSIARRRAAPRTHDDGRAGALADANRDRQPQPEGREQEQRRRLGDCGEAVVDAMLARRPWPEDGAHEERGRPAERGWWSSEPDVGRVVDGSSSRLDARIRRARLRCLGNGVVPQQGALAFVTLARRAGLELGGVERADAMEASA